MFCLCVLILFIELIFVFYWNFIFYFFRDDDSCFCEILKRGLEDGRSELKRSLEEREKMEFKKNKCRFISCFMERWDRYWSISIECRRSFLKDRLYSWWDCSGSRIRRYRENLRNFWRERSWWDCSGSR